MANSVKSKPWYRQKTIIGGAVAMLGQWITMAPTVAVVFTVAGVFPVTIPMIGLGVEAIGGVVAGWGIVDWKKKVTAQINNDKAKR